ncbi:MAG: CRISPR-associated endonuclease Cas2 [Phycisphaerales bacterium]|jgi:CRISPR-associated protein Cas2
MARRRYLVTYDISDDKRRTAVFRTLRDHGDHTQFSVFICDLSTAELVALRGLLSSSLNPRQDQILVLDLGDASDDIGEIVDTLGRAYIPPSRTVVV